MSWLFHPDNLLGTPLSNASLFRNPICLWLTRCCGLSSEHEFTESLFPNWLINFRNSVLTTTPARDCMASVLIKTALMRLETDTIRSMEDVSYICFCSIYPQNDWSTVEMGRSIKQGSIVDVRDSCHIGKTDLKNLGFQFFQSRQSYVHNLEGVSFDLSFQKKHVLHCQRGLLVGWVSTTNGSFGANWPIKKWKSSKNGGWNLFIIDYSHWI